MSFEECIGLCTWLALFFKVQTSRVRRCIVVWWSRLGVKFTSFSRRCTGGNKTSLNIYLIYETGELAKVPSTCFEINENWLLWINNFNLSAGIICFHKHNQLDKKNKKKINQYTKPYSIKTNLNAFQPVHFGGMINSRADHQLFMLSYFSISASHVLFTLK